MIFVDIDDMSMCNNIFGYEYGNALIKEFAGKLRGIKSKDKLICKAASDKFCLFVKDVTNQPEMVVFIEKLPIIYYYFYLTRLNLLFLPDPLFLLLLYNQN